MFILRTIAQTLSDLKNAIQSKLELQENAKMRLHFKKNEKLFILDDIEDLEEGMTIKVTVSKESQPKQETKIDDGKIICLSFFFSFPMESQCFFS